MANTKRASNANKTSQRQRSNAKSKNRNKNLNAFDDNKRDKEAAQTEAIEAFINKILNRRGLRTREKVFFKKMIDDVKNSEVDGFTLDDFYFLTKFNGSNKRINEASQALEGYFVRLCHAVENRMFYEDDKEALLCYENFKKARGLLNIALPINETSCRTLDEAEHYKKVEIESYKIGLRINFNFQKEELIAFYFEFIKRANNYFTSVLPSRRSPSIEEQKQTAKDIFRDTLRDMDFFYKVKIEDAIKNGKLTQNICDYVMKNYTDFLARFEEPEDKNRFLT